MDTQAHILIVDNPSNIDHTVKLLDDENYQLSVADSGINAWKLLSSEPDKFDVILLAEAMPDMGGLELIKKIQHHDELLCTVVLQTEIDENVDAGVQYYITKPLEKKALVSVINIAIRHQISYQHRVKNRLALSSLKTARFQFKTIHQAHALASLLSDHYPDPGKVITGLTELMINAVEHGNLAITYAEKSKFLVQGTLNQEIQRRLKLSEYKGRHVTVYFQLLEALIEITIEDQGDGFDWEEYMELDPSRLLEPHGRGIAIANKLSFCEVDYKGGVGNKVVARLYL